MKMSRSGMMLEDYRKFDGCNFFWRRLIELLKPWRFSLLSIWKLAGLIIWKLTRLQNFLFVWKAFECLTLTKKIINLYEFQDFINFMFQVHIFIRIFWIFIFFFARSYNFHLPNSERGTETSYFFVYPRALTGIIPMSASHHQISRSYRER